MKKATKQILAGNLKVLMDRTGCDQVALAKKISGIPGVRNVAQTSISNMLNTETAVWPNLATVEAVAAAFGLQAWQLIHPTLGDVGAAQDIIARIATAPLKEQRLVYQILELAPPSQRSINGGVPMAYRRRKDGDTWHFCSNCSNWPRSNYDEKPNKPAGGELCNECRAKERAGECS
jgi:transcriptional regulator with XRE-family HTH domain